MKVFLSSTYRDLVHARKAAIEALDRVEQTVAMEKFVASNKVSRDECLRQLQESDLVVLLIGGRYGSLDPESGLSITELEYRQANALRLPVLVFLKATSDGEWHSSEEDPEQRKKHEDFRRLVDSEKTRVTFRKPCDLKTEIAFALLEHERHYGLVGTRGAAFRTSVQFFARYLDAERIFNHTFPLIGRRSYIEHLRDVPTARERVFLVSGKGGIGKSKILQVAADEIADAHHSVTVCLLGEGVTFRREDAKELPGGQVVIVVDDAHRVEGLAELFAIVQQYPERMKLVLSTRPYGLPALRQFLVRAGFAVEEVREFPELRELAAKDVAALAREVIGPLDGKLVARLGDAAHDSPLIIVIAGQLLARRDLDPALLSTNDADAFRREVLSRFQDVLLGQVAVAFDSGLVRKVLQLLAALSPFDPGNGRLLERAAEFLHIEQDELVLVLDTLERDGVVMRRASALHLVPDVLSDSIFHEACFTSAGQLTGYSNRIIDRFGDLVLPAIMRNMAELDWQISRGKGTGLLHEVWKTVEDAYRLGTIQERHSLLGLVKDVAYFQPSEAISLVRKARAAPPPSPTQPGEYPFPEESLTHALAPILDAAGHYAEHLREAATLLWELGRDDERALNAFPDHPIRILTELAAYERGKPLDYNAIMLEWLEDLAHSEDAFRHRHTPYEIVGSLLAREGTDSWSEGHTFTLARYPIESSLTAPLRGRALDLVREVALHGDAVVRRGAVQILLDVIFRGLIGLGNYVPTEDEFARWQDEDRRILDVLGELLAKERNPLLIVEAEDDLLALREDPRRKRIAGDVDTLLAKLPHSLDTTLVRYIRQGHIQRRHVHREPDTSLDLAATDAEVARELDTAIAELCARYPSPDDVKRELERLLAHIGEVGIEPGDVFFFDELARRQPEFTECLCDLILEDPGSPLVEYLSPLLGHLRERSPAAFTDKLRRAIASGDIRLLRSAAWALRTVPSLDTPEERQLAHDFALHEDRTVAVNGILALHRFPVTVRGELFGILDNIGIEGDGVVADWVCQLFEGPNAVPLEQMPKSTMDRLLDRFTMVSDIAQHASVQDVLAWLVANDPEQAVAFYLARLDRGTALPAEERDEYRPVSFQRGGRAWPMCAERAQGERALRRIRERASTAGAAELRWLALLFAHLAARYGDAVPGALADWMKTPQLTEMLITARLLEHMGREFVFAQEQFVVALIEAAEAVGGEAPDWVFGSLTASAMRGGGFRPIGKSAPEDEALRDKASAAGQRYLLGHPARHFYERLQEIAISRLQHDNAREGTWWDE